MKPRSFGVENRVMSTEIVGLSVGKQLFPHFSPLARRERGLHKLLPPLMGGGEWRVIMLIYLIRLLLFRFL